MAPTEGCLKAPIRNPIAWQDPEFYDEDALNQELRRVFDICHGCRRCFNLCDSFPRLFDLIDATEAGEVDQVHTSDFAQVNAACTLCDMCFIAKCPYVPPHDFQIDFPHLMLRYRAVENQKNILSFSAKERAKTDRNGTLGSKFAPLANWANSRTRKWTRKILEKTLDIHTQAAIPSFHRPTLLKGQNTIDLPPLNPKAPGYGEKVILYATCFGNYNEPDLGYATLWVLAANGIQAHVVYPECCGMPQMELGNLKSVASKAQSVTQALKPWVEDGYQIIALIPSCALMLKSEWPLLLPEDQTIKKVASATQDLMEYLVNLATQKGLVPPEDPLEGPITLHIPCHARAQNIGRSAEKLLKKLPGSELHVIERCSGHGGTWGLCKNNFETALKVGRPVVQDALNNQAPYVVSECPLACLHIHQGLQEVDPDMQVNQVFLHPIQLVAHAYGFSRTQNEKNRTSTHS